MIIILNQTQDLLRDLSRLPEITDGNLHTLRLFNAGESFRLRAKEGTTLNTSNLACILYHAHDDVSCSLDADGVRLSVANPLTSSERPHAELLNSRQEISNKYN